MIHISSSQKFWKKKKKRRSDSVECITVVVILSCVLSSWSHAIYEYTRREGNIKKKETKMFFLPPFFGVWRKTRLSLWENNTKPKTILLFFFKEKKKINKKKFLLKFFFLSFLSTVLCLLLVACRCCTIHRALSADYHISKWTHNKTTKIYLFSIVLFYYGQIK